MKELHEASYGRSKVDCEACENMGEGCVGWETDSGRLHSK
jgi:hypothetical protein